MSSVQVSIEGTTPLLCNQFTDAAQQSATSGTRCPDCKGPFGKFVVVHREVEKAVVAA